MMNTHKEPWTFKQEKNGILIEDANGDLVCYEDLTSVLPRDRPALKSQYERIVECVNACAGIENPGEAIASARTHLEKIVRDRYADPASCADPSHLAQLALIELTPKV